MGLSSRTPELENQSLLKIAEQIAAEFSYTADDVCRCVKEFLKEMNNGLRERTPTMCQIPTYVTRVANGTEKGLSLAVDLGGTNLRVCSVDFHGDTTFTIQQTKGTIPQKLMVAKNAGELFSFITEQIEEFLQRHHPDCFNISGSRHVFSLGLVFSYPVYQNAINSGVLLRWTKGFDIPDVVGKDVCKLLQDEIDLKSLPVRVTALVNDAAGTIMARAYTLALSMTRTTIGAIFGTGTNGVYLEKLGKIGKPLDGFYDTSTGEMFLSTEWGSFNNHLSVLPNTPYDVELDKVSTNPGNQMFEKRVSGMFLGELLRIVALKMHTDPKIRLFQNLDLNDNTRNDSFERLHTQWAVDSSVLSAAELDCSEALLPLRSNIAQTFGIPFSQVSVEDARAIKLIANAIGRRAARLAGMAVGAVVLQSGQLKNDIDPVTGGNSTPSQEHGVVDVGVDGSVFEFYPGFETYMREALRDVEEIGVAGEKKIRIGIAKDGSGVGAAIIALLADGNH